MSARGLDDTLNPNDWRATFGALVMSGNTATEADLNRMAPYRITFAASRIVVPLFDFDSDEEFLKSVTMAGSLDALELAARALANARPRHVMFAVTSTTMWKGLAYADELAGMIQEWTGAPVTLGGNAVLKALGAVGARRVAMLSPYRQNVVDLLNAFVAEGGFEVVRNHNVSTRNVQDILRIQSAKGLLQAILEVDGDDVDAVVQVGANMSLLGVAQIAEGVIGKPVIPINVAALWTAMRAEGFDDRLEGLGALFRDH